MDLSERKLKVLQAIISDYVRTAEPVGSRTLSKKPELGYSRRPFEMRWRIWRKWVI